MAERKRNEGPERQALREMMAGYLKDNTVKNSYRKKTMHTSYGDMELDILRYRNCEYEPHIIKKYQNTLTQDMTEDIALMELDNFSE